MGFAEDPPPNWKRPRLCCSAPHSTVQPPFSPHDRPPNIRHDRGQFSTTEVRRLSTEARPRDGSPPPSQARSKRQKRPMDRRRGAFKSREAYWTRHGSINATLAPSSCRPLARPRSSSRWRCREDTFDRPRRSQRVVVRSLSVADRLRASLNLIEVISPSVAHLSSPPRIRAA